MVTQSPRQTGEAAAAAQPRLRTLDELDVAGRRVLLRCDLDVPLKADGAIVNDHRIRVALPTLQELRDRGAAIVVAASLRQPMAHGRSASMAPVAARLQELTAAAVVLAPAATGQTVFDLSRRLAPAEVLVLENLFCDAGEVRNDSRFAHALASLADVYVNDAFKLAHLRYASTTAVPRLLPSAAGRQFEHDFAAYAGQQVERWLPALAPLLAAGGSPLAYRHPMRAITDLKSAQDPDLRPHAQA